MLELLLAALLGQQPAAPAGEPGSRLRVLQGPRPAAVPRKAGGQRALRDLPRRQRHAAAAAPTRRRDAPGRRSRPARTSRRPRRWWCPAVPAPASSCAIRCRAPRAATSFTAAASTGRRRTIRTGRCWRPGSTAPTMASYTKRASATKVARIIQTNAAGDNIHLIDPATNKVVEVINDIEVPHGVTSAPDGTRHVFHQRSAAHARRRRFDDARGDRARSPERTPQQRRDLE